ncbi:ParA family protein [Francisella orientalis]|uniref:Chromosome partition protein A, ATPase n=1 Tax=Francisella orientalis TaxID=299583 RepID=A0AAP7FWL3_9GAMM|nr:ParA family protein [Francisella orientalis]AFJ42953.1 chromosome partition protein A, ATPase [Francisella orientalis str. Toba 04]AHB98050.1 chromosome partitioning protein ParA [Francisella orientalis LADL 07-285A]AKN85185.1 Chromosome partition protein A, ATPase [Francisella orientalis FNO12]AKN86724.1 Chromosome partition protein A, ATPase [Francisella orientalis FNO24]AKN88263.1 Chromosome partition protein A, ATPase [Francisella orientalis]
MNQKCAKVVSLLQQKGGSGKTTTAINIACGLKEQGYKVAIVDMDKDKPDAYMWMTKKSDASDFVYNLDEKNVREKVMELKQNLDFVVIDTPPNFQTAALKSALLSDLVVIPCSPSGMDLSGLIEAKDLALTAEKPYKFFANRVQMQSNMAKSLLEFFEEDGNFFEAYVSQSVKFIEAEAEGVYVGDYAKQSKVHIQVKKLAREIIEFFGEEK